MIWPVHAQSLRVLKIRERTVSGIDLLTLGLFESVMKRRHY